MAPKPRPLDQESADELAFLAEEFRALKLEPGEFTVAQAAAKHRVPHGVAGRLLEKLLAEGKVTRRLCQSENTRRCWAYRKVKK